MKLLDSIGTKKGRSKTQIWERKKKNFLERENGNSKIFNHRNLLIFQFRFAAI